MKIKKITIEIKAYVTDEEAKFLREATEEFITNKVYEQYHGTCSTSSLIEGLES